MDDRAMKTILLVEDEAIIAMDEAKTIERFGYKVLTAGSGEKAVALSNGNDAPDLVLMDIDLGKGIDGTEAARQILVTKNIPIVFLTSHSERVMVEKVRGITRYGYVIKNAGSFVLQSSIEMAFELFEAHEKTKGKEAELEAIYENAPIVMMLLDNDRRVRKANDRALHYSGMDLRDILGVRSGVAMRCLNAIESPDGCGFGPQCAACMIRRTVLETFDNGQSHYDIVATLPIDVGGKRVESHFILSTKLLKIADTQLVLASLMDITERKKAEDALLRSEHRNVVLNRIASVFLTLSDEQVYPEVMAIVLGELESEIGLFGNIANDGDLMLSSLIGKGRTQSGERVEPVAIHEVSSGDTILAKILRGKRPMISEGPFDLPAGYAPVEVILGAPIVSGEEAIGLIAVANGKRPYTDADAAVLDDIARYISPILNARLQRDRKERERMRAEEDLRLLNEELELRVRERTMELERKNARLRDLDRLRSMFVASMSQELRTPLNSIIGFSSILGEEWAGPISPEQKDDLSTINRSGKLLLSLINNVIDVSEIEAGTIEARYESFDLHGLLEEAARYVENEARAKGLDLRLHIHRQLLHSDRRRLMQCVINLLLNAIKFTEKGEIRLSSETAPPGSSRLPVAVTVRDTGFGIAEADINRLFQPFVRLDSSEKAKATGPGLGLYLTRRLAEEILQGEIVCESVVGEGSIFTLSIPEKVDEKGTGRRG